MGKRTTNRVQKIVAARTAANQLTTSDFLAYELDADIRVVRTALFALCGAGVLRARFNGPQVLYSAEVA